MDNWKQLLCGFLVQPQPSSKLQYQLYVTVMEPESVRSIYR